MQRKRLNFLDAMKLEIERLRLNLSAAERDRALLAAGTDPASINPNLLLDDPQMIRLCRVANSVAMAGQTALEDKITTSIGLDLTDDNPFDFWNVPSFGDICSGGQCEVQVEKDETLHVSNIKSHVDSSKLFICSNCGKKVCKICCAGKGASLLASYSARGSLSSGGGQGRSVSSHGGSSHGGQVDVYSNNNYVSSNGVICKQCCNDVVQYALVLDYVRTLLSSRRSTRVGLAAFTALDQVLGFGLTDGTVERSKLTETQKFGLVLGKLLDGQESLAEFPFASFLHSVIFSLFLFLFTINFIFVGFILDEYCVCFNLC